MESKWSRALLCAWLISVSGVTSGCAEMSSGGLGGAMLGSLGGGDAGQLDAQTVAAGLKEALEVGTERAVAVTSSADGFLGNALIRIAMPDQLGSMATTLRTVGLGAQVDELEVAMNRAAEKAAGEAKDVFWTAISRMKVSDAVGILNGGDTAATDYFRVHTSEELRQRFEPIVSEKMEEVGLYRVYEGLAASYAKLPLVTRPAFDLTGYVTNGALDGLFTTLGQEETRIRENPSARSTELLRRVFGG